MAGSREHSKEPSCSIKKGKFLQAERLSGSRVGLCSMKLVALYLTLVRSSERYALINTNSNICYCVC